MKKTRLMRELEEKAPRVKFPEYSLDFELFTTNLQEVVSANLSVRGWNEFEYCDREGKYFLAFRFPANVHGVKGTFEKTESLDPRMPLEPQIRDLDERLLNLVRKLNKDCD